MSAGLFLGLSTVDIIYGIDSHPAPNEKLKANWQLAYAGGPAANAAVAFSVLGNESRLCSGLGNHPVVALATKDLGRHGVVVHDCILDPDEPPVISSIFVNSLSGDRCVVYSNTDGRCLSEEIDYPSILDGCKVVLLDGYYLVQAVALASNARERGVLVVFDGGSWKSGLEELLPYVDYAVCSENFIPPGCSDLTSVFDYLSVYDMAGCAVSRGDKPLVVEAGGERSQISVPDSGALDTLGAGDILHGAFCNYILANSFKKSLEKAVIVASDSCRYYGTRQWIKNWKKQTK